MRSNPQQQPKDPKVMRVKATSDVHKVAAAIHHQIMGADRVNINVLGSGPMQQAAKAIAIASGKLRTAGYDLVTRFSMFDEKQADGKELTIMQLRLQVFKL